MVTESLDVRGAAIASKRAGPGPCSDSGPPRKRSEIIAVAVVAAMLLLAAGVIGPGGGGGAGAQTLCATPVPPGSLPPAGVSTLVCYPPGWSLVGGPEAIRWPVPITVWDPVASQYKQYPVNTQFVSLGLGTSVGIGNGQGAWAYFSQTTSVDLGVMPGPGPVPVALAVGGWQQVGNPFALASAALCGSGFSAFSYNPATGAYAAVTVLLPGQGAWVYAAAGGTLTIEPVGRPTPPNPCG